MIVEVSTPTDGRVKVPGRKWGQSHLQSMFLVFYYPAMAHLREHLPCTADWVTQVLGGEVMWTVSLLAAGYSVTSQVLAFRGVDWGNAQEANAICDRNGGGDMMAEGKYLGI